MATLGVRAAMAVAKLSRRAMMMKKKKPASPPQKDDAKKESYLSAIKDRLVGAKRDPDDKTEIGSVVPIPSNDEKAHPSEKTGSVYSDDDDNEISPNSRASHHKKGQGDSDDDDDKISPNSRASHKKDHGDSDDDDDKIPPNSRVSHHKNDQGDSDDDDDKIPPNSRVSHHKKDQGDSDEDNETLPNSHATQKKDHGDSDEDDETSPNSHASQKKDQVDSDEDDKPENSRHGEESDVLTKEPPVVEVSSSSSSPRNRLVHQDIIMPNKQCRFMALLFVFVLHLLVTWFVFKGLMFKESKDEDKESKEKDKQRYDYVVLENLTFDEIHEMPTKIFTIVMVVLVIIQACYFTLFLLFVRHLCGHEVEARHLMLIDWKILGTIIPSFLVVTIVSRIIRVYFMFVGDPEQIRDVDLVLLFSMYLLLLIAIFTLTSKVEFTSDK
jgi:hypothetical protein